MRRPATPKPIKEVTLHMQVAAFLRAAWPADLPWSHFPAGEVRDPRTGAKLKAMGLAPGWADFIFLLPKGRVAFLELKRIDGVLTLVQIEFRDRAIAAGAGYAVCTSLEEVAAKLTEWLALFGRELRGRIAA